MIKNVLSADDLVPRGCLNFVELIVLLDDKTLTATIEPHAQEYLPLRGCLQRLSLCLSGPGSASHEISEKEVSCKLRLQPERKRHGQAPFARFFPA
jgi:hypothetical protein